MVDKVGIAERESIEKTAQAQETKEAVRIELEIDPSFPNEENIKLESTIRVFESFVEGEISRPVRQLKIWVFPEERLGEMNAQLESLGFMANLGTKEEGMVSATSRRQMEDDTSVEIFLSFGETTLSVARINEVLGHELAHLLEGISRDYNVRGEIGDLIRKPIGVSERVFDSLKELLRDEGYEPTCYINKGLERILECSNPKGEKWYGLVRGRSLNELAVSLVGEILSREGSRSQVIEELGSIVDSGEIMFAYITGDTRGVKRAFEEKTGHSFEEFVELLDEHTDVLETERFSEEAVMKAKQLEEKALEYLKGRES